MMFDRIRFKLSRHKQADFKPIVIHSPPPPGCFYAQTESTHKIGDTVEWKRGEHATVRSVAKHPVKGQWIILKNKENTMNSSSKSTPRYVCSAIVIFLILVLLSVLLSACGGSSVTEGTVKDKQSEAGEWETKKVSGTKTCTGTGAKRKCKTGASTTKREWDDPDFFILIEKCEKKDCNEAWVDVSESVYNSVDVGDYYKP